ncbi:hypothetical protein [Neobacillus sp. Marseille-QA0830]
MHYERQKAMMLAEQMNEFIRFVVKSHENQKSLHPNTDKIYQIKLWIEDFKFQIIADELIRINQYDWDEKYTHYLVGQFEKGIHVIEEYVKNNYHDLFIFTARLYTLTNLSQSFHNLKTNVEN